MSIFSINYYFINLTCFKCRLKKSNEYIPTRNGVRSGDEETHHRNYDSSFSKYAV